MLHRKISLKRFLDIYWYKESEISYSVSRNFVFRTEIFDDVIDGYQHHRIDPVSLFTTQTWSGKGSFVSLYTLLQNSLNLTFFLVGGEGGLKVPSNFVLRKMRKCSRKVEKNCICIWGSGLFPLQSLVCFQLFFFFSSSSFSPFPCVVFLISIKTNKQKTPKNKNKKHGGLMVLHTFKGS